MKVLFVTRKFPPSVGGMQNFSYDLITHYTKPKEVIALGKKQYHLVWFLPYAMFKSLFLILTRQVTVVHLGDGVLTPLGYLIKAITRTPVVVTAHGLDISYNHYLYQKFMPFFITRMDLITCVSNATAQACKKIGVSESRLVIIPNGIATSQWSTSQTREGARASLSEHLGVTISPETKLLLSVGRHVKRKGFSWFLKHVMPQLPKNYYYIIMGGTLTRDEIENTPNLPEETKNILQAIHNHNLENQTTVTGKVPQELLNQAYLAADVFIMPNIPQPGDMEGFGIVTLEASVNGTPVVASRMEGLQDAILPNTTGVLVTPSDPASFVEGITHALKLDRDSVKENLKQNFSWDIIVKQYENAFRHTTS